MSDTGNGKMPKTLRVERRDNVAIVFMDVPGEPVNTLRDGFHDEFKATFATLENASDVAAIVFASAKPDSFLAGADISMLLGVRSASEAERLSRAAQEAMNRLDDSPKPVVAAIHGACLGGGLELALACDARIATDHPKTKLGLPEVQLGLLPGAGGTVRLPALLGAQAALDLLLTGKQVDARKARKLGLVDEVVPPAILLEVAVKRARERVEGTTKVTREPWYSGKRLREAALAGNPLGRKVLFDQAKKALLKKTQGNYPAPEHILAVVQAGLEGGRQTGLDAEAKSFGELAMTPEAKQLMNIFFAQQALKKDTGTDQPAEARTVDRIGVLGAGLMGAGVAYVSAVLAKVPVRMKDKDDAGLLSGLKYVHRLLDESVQRKRMSRADADRLMHQVTATTGYEGIADAPLVIEAVFEDLSLKQRVLRDVENGGRSDVIFASNTSSIPIGKIAEASGHPETVIGMHYFSPVHKMPLLEIIVTDKTAPWVTATCVAFGKKQGKTVIVVRDGTGFYTTRILMPFMNEAAFVLSEGVSIETIDKALVRFGFPVGPIKLMDEVGIDVGAKIGKIMVDAFGERMAPPPLMSKLVADKRYGRKNERGFYLYEGKKKGVDESVYALLGITPHDKADKEDLAWRCTLLMVNEAVRCLEEGILRSPRDGDIGAVFGLGFPPFLGGPFRFVDRYGAAEIVRRLEAYRAKHGARFEPAAKLVQTAQNG